jgi:RNA polymerase sigma-70 factor (ECF subfamily)
MTDQPRKISEGRAKAVADGTLGGAPKVESITRHPEDERVIERLLAKDEAAFRALVERYHGSLLRVARAFVSDHATAEEVVQETWLGVINGLPRFERRSTLKTWIFRILTNRAQSRGKREARSRPFSSFGDSDLEAERGAAVDPERFTASGAWADPPQSWGKHSPEEFLLKRETAELIERAIAELPENQRVVVTLRDIEGLSGEEICNVLQISETNQRVLLHRGRSRLRRALERYLAGK